jgi:uncharacterized membrane protein YbhN (UPF0104 family)
MNVRQKDLLVLGLKVLVRQSLAGLNPGIFLAGIALQLGSYLAGAVRWWQLFSYLAGPVPFARVWPTYYLGVFFNNFLPTAYGGDVARSARLYMSGMSGNALVASAVMDRLLGLTAVAVIGGLALLLSKLGTYSQWAGLVFAAATAIIAATVILLKLPAWSELTNPAKSGRWSRARALLSNFLAFRDSPTLLLKGFLLSLLSQLFVVGAFVLLARALGIGIPVESFVALLMLVFLVASLPISLGGLGPREGALMALLLPFGVEAAAVLALSAAYLIILWISTLPGLFMLFTRATPPASAQP